MRDRLVEAAEQPQRQRQVVVQHRVGRAQPDGGLEAGARFVCPAAAEPEEKVAEIVERVDIGRIQPQRVAEAAFGALELAHIGQGAAQIAMNFRDGRTEPQGIAIGGDGVAGAAEIAQYAAEIIVIFGDRGFEHGGAPEMVQRKSAAPGLVGQQAHPMVAIGVVGHRGQHLAVGCLGLGKGARLVARHADREGRRARLHVRGHRSSRPSVARRRNSPLRTGRSVL